MTTDISFRYYTPQDREACLTIFDENCPEYEVCILNGAIVGAYGLVGTEQEWRSLNWILISPKVQGVGIGSEFMNRVVSMGKAAKLVGIKIAASHLSSPFFAKHGAIPIRELENGWGMGMHRVDMELKL